MGPETAQDSEGTWFELGQLVETEASWRACTNKTKDSGRVHGPPTLTAPPSRMATTPSSYISSWGLAQVTRGPCGFSVFVSTSIVHRHQPQHVSQCSFRNCYSLGLVLSTGANYSPLLPLIVKTISN